MYCLQMSISLKIQYSWNKKIAPTRITINPSYRKVNPLHRKNTAIPNKPAPITQVTSYPIVNNGSLLIN